jgi:hypothetical protein
MASGWTKPWPMRVILYLKLQRLECELQRCKDASPRVPGPAGRLVASRYSWPSNPMQLKGWIVRDNQSLETRVDLMDLKAVGRIGPRLFDPSARLERRW